MRIFLIGYMGVGKTTIGKKLAASLSLKFIDLDKYIAQSCGVSVAHIILYQGEEYFRIIEKKYLQEVVLESNVLISTGGGTPCFFDNMDVMNRNGVSVYLEMDEKSLAKRLINSSNSRPLLKGKTLEELEVFISEHLESRRKYYAQSKISVHALNMSGVKIKDLAHSILAGI